MLSLADRSCLVVGGGGVALRKVEGLLAAGARVSVVAPDPAEPLAELARKGEIELGRRAYRPGEAAGFYLVFAATDDDEVNRRVSDDAEQAGVLVNVADDPDLCAFHLPARVQRGSLQLAVASAGEAPFVVRRLRQLLEKRFGAEWSEWIEAAARFRAEVRQAGLSTEQKERLYDRFFRSTVDALGLTARVPPEAEQASWLSKASRDAGPGPSNPPPPSEGASKGFVSLVGAGPGDAGLLSVRARQRMHAAGAVVYDRLAATAIPTDLPRQVELHPVGKRAGHHPVPQEEINALLVRLAREGKRVVRLKGGDPFVFGRGGEEAEALAAAGVPFEVVPAVTAGVAVPAYSGIPVTHRREVVRLTMLTAHESEKEGGPRIRWDLIAADPALTLIGYMGVTSLPRVVEGLLGAGMDPGMPAAMIARGTTSRQRVVTATVSELPAAVERNKVKPPALFVIGPSVRHAANLDWFGSRPLFGERIVIARPAGETGEVLEMNGAEVVEVPLPVTPAARIVLNALPLTACVLRTTDEVEALDEERDGAGWGPEAVAFCLSEEAAERARGLGWSGVESVAVPRGATDLLEHFRNRRAGG
jgi:uroporphyrin-III C-methyltransferase/precorrin-2 dehydrogenase/sirohydrochlorin ferrochelatase